MDISPRDLVPALSLVGQKPSDGVATLPLVQVLIVIARKSF